MLYSFMLHFAMMRTNFTFDIDENTDFPSKDKSKLFVIILLPVRTLIVP